MTSGAEHASLLDTQSSALPHEVKSSHTLGPAWVRVVFPRADGYRAGVCAPLIPSPQYTRNA
jgi:hypothetical protein